MKLESIAIIGNGKVGQSLAQLANKKNYKTELIGRDVADQQRACDTADLIIIAVSDDVIKELAQQLAQHIAKPVIVTHCSGALSSDELSSAELAGALTASCHPLNTFPTLDASLKTFNNIDHGSYLFAEGNNDALSALNHFYTSLGFKFRTIDKQAKSQYHLACSMACNYFTVLMHSSLDIAESAGLQRDEFYSALSPLLNKTIENINNFGSLNSLSGPIARGDLVTIKKHQKALAEQNNNTRALYAELGKIAANMAKETGNLSEQEYKTIMQALSP